MFGVCTKQTIWGRHLGLFVTIYWYFIEQTTTQSIKEIIDINRDENNSVDGVSSTQSLMNIKNESTYCHIHLFSGIEISKD